MRTLALLTGWGLAAAIVAMTWGPMSLRPQTGHPQIERFAAYLALGAAFSVAYPRRLSWVIVGLVIVAVGLEFGQHFVHRDPGAADAGVKALGAMGGVLLIRALRGPDARSQSRAGSGA
jgi:peptidoglycan/LPS O-acetylase OafA/YrhL